MFELDELAELRQRIVKLERPESVEPEFEPKWDPYEECFQKDPINLIKSHFDSEMAPMDKLKKFKVSQLKDCLRFFEGENSTIKKGHLMRFLRRFPGYRTLNLKVLEQRLYVTRKWMKENGYEPKLIELHNLIIEFKE